jgi:hypothetical protein
MHQNIQNFSELTAININKLVKIVADIRSFDNASYQLNINGKTAEQVHYVDLLESINIQITKQGAGLIDIASIKINDYEIMPKYLIYADPPTNRLEQETIWNLSIRPNFYTWYHTTTGQGFIA